jgi:hypothetical protein
MKNQFDLGYSIRWWDKFNSTLYLTIIRAKQANK